jgi:hypothetical protein
MDKGGSARLRKSHVRSQLTANANMVTTKVSREKPGKYLPQKTKPSIAKEALVDGVEIPPEGFDLFNSDPEA